MRYLQYQVNRLHKEDPIETPTAVIGNRGTVHDIRVDASGTFDKVISGGTTMTNAFGSVNIDAGQVGFASRVAAPRIISR